MILSASVGFLPTPIRLLPLGHATPERYKGAYSLSNTANTQPNWYQSVYGMLSCGSQPHTVAGTIALTNQSNDLDLPDGMVLGTADDPFSDHLAFIPDAPAERQAPSLYRPSLQGNRLKAEDVTVYGLEVLPEMIRIRTACIL